MRLIMRMTQIDAEIGTPKINLALFNEIKKLEPFGMGNPKPVFLTRRLAISRLQLVGKEQKHLKLVLNPSQEPIANGQQLEAISFNCEECQKDLKIGEIIDIVFNLDENEWNGSRKVQLKIIDIKNCK